MPELCHEIATYLDYCKYRKKLNVKTLKAYSIDLTQFKQQLHEPAEWLDRTKISTYITYLHKTFSPKSAKRKLASIKAFFSYLEYEEIIDVNPLAKMKTKFQEPKTLPRTVPLNIIEDILSSAYKKLNKAETAYGIHAAQRDIAVLELLFATGMRVSELCALNACDVNLDDGNIRIMGKGAKERILQVINQEVLEALSRYKDAFSSIMSETGVFFVNRCGLRYSEQSVRFMIRRSAVIRLKHSATLSRIMSLLFRALRL